MAKLPGIVQQPVGEWQSGQIRQPDYLAKGSAITSLLSQSADAIKTIAYTNAIADVSKAEGEAANELGELRSTLENETLLPYDMVPDDVLAPMEMSIQEGLGGRREISRPFVRTHEVANEIWAKRSREIIDHHAQTISNPKAKAKFIGEMTERYMAPGTASIAAKTITDSRAAAQAQMETTLANIASSAASLEDREEMMRSTIARGAIMGFDPVWVENQVQKIGPMIDQIDYQVAINGAKEPDELQQIEEELWTGANRLTPETRRTMSIQIDQKRRDFKAEETERQDDNADQMFGQFVRGELTNAMLDEATTTQQITRGAGITLYNMLNKGATTTVSNPATISRYELEIARLPYTGGSQLVSQKAEALERIILGQATGTDAQGNPTGLEPTISGADALELITKVRAAPDKIKDNDPYREAVRQVKAYTGVKDEFGALFGDQPNVDAYVAFKNSLDAYMDQFGVDADPIGYITTNRGIFTAENYEDPVNEEFVDKIPFAKGYMEVTPEGNLIFPEEKRTLFMGDLSKKITSGDLSREEANIAAAYFMAFYRGQGTPPQGGRLQVPEDSEFYGQFR